MGSTGPIPVRTRSDITLELVQAVAWRGASLAIAPDALAVMDRSHASFEAFVAERIRADPQALVRPLGDDCRRLTDAFAGQVFA